MTIFAFFYKPKSGHTKYADTNLKLARFPARRPLPVAALPSMSLIPQLHSRIHTKRFGSCFKLMKFVTIRAIRVTERPIRHLRGKFHKIPELWLAVPLEGLYENLLLVKSKSFPITSAHEFLCARNCRRVTNVAER